ncbi:MAG: hypothetical protein ACMXYM_00815 [Candidatus Woesearchaeota archaeon]
MLLAGLLILPAVTADTIAVSDSREWTDVYSVLLHSTMNDGRAVFLNSETLTGLLRTVSERATIEVYESSERPFVRNTAQKLRSAGYTVADDTRSASFNLDLDPQNGRYFVISEDYYRIGVAVAPIAVAEDRWVLIANDRNIDEIAQRLEGAQSVVAVGSFRRDLLSRIEGTFDEWIREDSVFAESQILADRYDSHSNIILADGFSIESEFFTAKSPVIIVGYNRVSEQTYEWILSRDVRSVVVIGNRLAVVGEQIRERSERRIGVFIKFGQSDTQASGRIYALTMFPLPQPLLGLTIQRAVYDPSTEELIAFFENIGNIGLYETTTISVKTGDEEVAAVSDDEINYLGTGEVFAKRYPVSIPIDRIDDSTVAEFFTSFGLTPSELDTFLTMENRFGPPFTIPLTVETVDAGDVSLELVEAAYYPRLGRVGVTIKNTGSEQAHYNVRVQQILVNGLPTDLFSQDRIRAGEEKTTYLPVRLDEIDMQENDVLSIDILYGASQDALLLRITEDVPFQTKSGGLLAGLVTGGAGAAVAGLIALLVIAALGMFFYVKTRR